MTAAELRTSSEKVLFGISFAISLVAWIVLVVTIFGLLYGLMLGLFLYMAHALMIAQVKGNGVRISQTQFPELHKRITEAARKLELRTTPDAYVLQAGGILNAFATKFSGRNFLVIYSDLLEASDESTKEIDMIIGHEIGHLALGHLKWIWFLLPARVLPWLGPAYSRACEYSCDLCGAEAAGGLDDATRGLAILAAGGKYGRQMNLDSYMKQAEDTRGFWTSVYELNASHPYLPKRIAAVVNHKKPGTVPAVGRHLLAYPLAPVFSIGGAPGGGMIAMVAVIAILAAIAIPQFSKYRERAKQHANARAIESPALPAALAPNPAIPANMDETLQNISAAAQIYHAANAKWPCTIEELDFPDIVTYSQGRGWQVRVTCDPNMSSLVYERDGQKVYRAINFETGQIEDGMM